MRHPSTLLGGLSAADFLRDYWQKRPLLIRGALPGFTTPIAPEELAGLACEEGVASRLVLERGGAYPWELRYGPFDEDDFASLPPSHWTLLVQEVDSFVPEVADLRDLFRFVPSWRIDDVMVSYAPNDGGVGAHIDNYDVFLLQGLGHRRWEIGRTPVENERLVEDVDVRVLADFEPDEDWVLGPGDMLYLPPRIAHRGTALDDCMTFSIGFRAPSHADIAEGFLAFVADQVGPGPRYSDPDLKPQLHPGEISPTALEQVSTILRGFTADDRLVAEWFGRSMTAPKRGLYAATPEEETPPTDLAQALEDGATLYRNPVVRFAYHRYEDGSATLFAGGEAYALTPSLAPVAPLLTDDGALDRNQLTPYLADNAFLDLIAELVNEGYLLVS